MDEDAKRKVLEDAAIAADAVVDQHERQMHPGYGECQVSQQMRHVGGAIRQHLVGGSGPAQIASEAYRGSWERTFGGKRAVVGQA